MFEAEEGDAFLISFGKDHDVNILIDMGLEKTYQNYIKPELIDLNSKGKKINVLVISHIDKDHIGGALRFIEENSVDHNIIKVEDVWHNTFRHMQFDKKKVGRITKEEFDALRELKMQNQSNSVENGLSDITVKDGVSLGSSLMKFNYNWNAAFNGGPVCSDNDIEYCIGDVKIMLLSPNPEKIVALSKLWQRELEGMIYGFNISDEDIFDDAFELFMQNEKALECTLLESSHDQFLFDIEDLSKVMSRDLSKTNGSSISFIVEYEKKKMLFLGDAHEDIIYDKLFELRNGDYDLNFDIVKISHHGSNKNISNRLLSLIESKRFLISTNGRKYNHPNIEAISKILMKTSKQQKEIIFNYDLPKMQFLNNEELKLKYNYEVKCCNEVELQ